MPECYICGETLGGIFGLGSWGRTCRICGEYACCENGHLSKDDICINCERSLPTVRCIICGRGTKRPISGKCHACQMRTAGAQYRHR